MKFLVTKTFIDGSFYDRLFLLLGNKKVQPLDLFFVEHNLNQNTTTIKVPRLPSEIKARIIKQTVIELLKDFNFEAALLLVALNTHMIHHFYYAIYGGGCEDAITKYRRLSRTIQICCSLYDNYMLAEKVCIDHTIVLDYDGNWILSPSHIFYPWDMAPEISVIQVYHSQEHGLQVSLGPYYGDQALLLHPREHKGIYHCEGLALPFLHILLMDQFRLLSVFASPRTKYYFARFSMLLKALFGKFTRVYFFTNAIPLSALQSDDDFDAIFDQGYCFEEVPNCVRK